MRAAHNAAAPLPHGEPDQLQAVELAAAEVQLGIREFAGRVPLLVRGDFDDRALDVTSVRRLNRRGVVNERVIR